MEQTERDLTKQAARLNTQEEFIAWEHRCDEFIGSLEEQSQIKRPRLSIGETIIDRSYRATRKFERRGAWTFRASRRRIQGGIKIRREIDTAFESRIPAR